MSTLKVLALVYCVFTLWAYFNLSIKSPQRITISLFGSEKTVSKGLFVLSNLFDGILIAIALQVIFTS